MKAMKAMILLAGLCVFQVARTGIAEASPCSGLFCQSTTISKLFPISNSGTSVVNVRVTDGGEPNLSCGPAGGPAPGAYLALKTSHPLFNEIYAALLSATVNNKRVTFRVVSPSTDCEIAYIVLENP
jgi:hypothetical protein